MIEMNKRAGRMKGMEKNDEKGYSIEYKENDASYIKLRNPATQRMFHE